MATINRTLSSEDRVKIINSYQFRSKKSLILLLLHLGVKLVLIISNMLLDSKWVSLLLG
jgi:hypothetical protein